MRLLGAYEIVVGGCRMERCVKELKVFFVYLFLLTPFSDGFMNSHIQSTARRTIENGLVFILEFKCQFQRFRLGCYTYRHFSILFFYLILSSHLCELRTSVEVSVRIELD